LLDADNAGNQFNGVWGSAVRNRYKSSGEPLSSVPGFMKGYVRKKFLGKDGAHPAGRIPQGVVAERLEYKGSGKGETADLESFFRLIDEIVIR
jgi:hypothetical protein